MPLSSSSDGDWADRAKKTAAKIATLVLSAQSQGGAFMCSLAIEWTDIICPPCNLKRHHMVVTLDGKTKTVCQTCQKVTMGSPKAAEAAAKTQKAAA
jgi:hypothetical protein